MQRFVIVFVEKLRFFRVISSAQMLRSCSLLK